MAFFGDMMGRSQVVGSSNLSIDIIKPAKTERDRHNAGPFRSYRLSADPFYHRLPVVIPKANPGFNMVAENR